MRPARLASRALGVARAFAFLALVGCGSHGSVGLDGEAPESGLGAGEAMSGADDDDGGASTSQVAGGSLEPSAREVSFAGEGLTLEGVLELPARAEGELVPGMVLVHGSGPVSRDERVNGQLNLFFGFELPVFEQLSARLVAAGYAVLRYDKRTCGRFNGCGDNDYPLPGSDVTIGDFQGDAASALEFLEAQGEVDPGRVFVVGHSQGSSLVPFLVRDDPAVAAGVMLAAPFRPVDELLAFQRDSSLALLELFGVEPDAEGAAELAELDALVEGLAAVRAGNESAVPNGGFWRSWMELGDEVPAVAAALDRPLLVLSGDYDWNVPPSEAELWRAELDSSESGPGHVVETVPCVTHVLNCVTEPDVRLLEEGDIGREVYGPFVDRVVEFLASVR